MGQAKQMRGAVDRYLAAWQTGNREDFLSLFAPTATIEDPVGSPVNEGKEAIAAFWDRIRALGLDYEAELHRVVCCDNECVADFTIRSTQGGMGMAVHILDHFQFNADGEISAMRAFWDDASMSTVP